MSDFLSRLAARAVGDASESRPSAPASGLDVSPAPTGPAAEAPVVRATPAAPEVRSEAPEAPPELPATAADSDGESDPPMPAKRADGAETPARREPRRQPSQPRPRERAEPPPRATRTSAAPVVVPAAPVAAVPVVRHVAETRLERVRSVTTVAADEPPVRVHIGRLEVRANLEQQAPKPARREPPRQEGVSLADYLRGRRSA